MNLTKMFEAQKVLRDRIAYNEPDRFNKLILALLVELGECANEWRGFKFWSTNQQPSIKKVRGPYMDLDDAEFYNPLLEEYVDGLHFVLELGIEIEVDKFTPSKLISLSNDVTGNFRSIYRLASSLDYMMLLLNDGDYRTLFNNYLHLGESLGFTWEEIEQAYFDKNAINHQRQEVGY